MKKSTKGALAAAAAGSLLLGGAGSLANWTGSQDVTGGTISSGKLTLSEPDCSGTNGTHDWQFDGGGAFTTGADGSKVVPGDTITKVCNMTLVLEGDHVGATLALDSAAIATEVAASNTLDTELMPTATFTVNGGAYTPITNPGTYTVKATVTVNLPETVTSTSGQNVSAALNNITLLATQTHGA
jgi:alternate signal-mediated exported protein